MPIADVRRYESGIHVPATPRRDATTLNADQAKVRRRLGGSVVSVGPPPEGNRACDCEKQHSREPCSSRRLFVPRHVLSLVPALWDVIGSDRAQPSRREPEASCRRSRALSLGSSTLFAMRAGPTTSSSPTPPRARRPERRQSAGDRRRGCSSVHRLARGSTLCAALCAVLLPRRCTSLHDRAGRWGRGPRCRVGAGNAQGRARARSNGQRQWRERRDSNPCGRRRGAVADAGRGSRARRARGRAAWPHGEPVAWVLRRGRVAPPTAPAGASHPGRLPPHPVPGSSPRGLVRRSTRRPSDRPRGVNDGGSGGTRTRDLRLDRPAL